MRRCLALLPLGSMLLSACAETPEKVSLHSDTGRLSLSYSCSDRGLRVLGSSDLDLARGAIAQQVAEHILEAPHAGRQTRYAQAVEEARQANDLNALERAVVAYVCTHGQPPERAPRFPERGSTPPDVEMRQVLSAGDEFQLGSEFRLRDYEGRVVVLNFWSTWCAPCVKEIPELQEIAERYHDRGVRVYGVIHRDNPEAALKWLGDRGLSLSLLFDRSSAAANAYHVRGIPDTYIIGRDGKVVRRTVGYWPGRLEQVVQEVLEM